MSIVFRSPVLKPLYRLQSPVRTRTLNDPNTFEITQRFADRDFYWNDGRTHAAVDIGNGHCGDAIVAMANGVAYRVQDNAASLGAPSNALGVVVDHGQNVRTEYWHLNGWTITHGQQVAAGQQIGVLGSTGLGSVCHCHIEMKVNGVKVDPEPYMFGAVYGEGMSDMPAFGGGQLRAIAETKRTKPGARFRALPDLSAEILHTFDGGVELPVNARVTGAAYNGDQTWYGAWAYVGDSARYRYGFMHAATVDDVPAPVQPTPDCGPAVKAATDPLLAKIGQARTELNGAAQALTRLGEALK